MSRLDANERARLPDTAFAYIDSRGRRRLPINDEPHVRNALSRFNQVRFESEAAKERARTRLLRAAKKYGIVPIGFITGQIESERTHAAAGRLVIELGRNGAPGELESRLREVLGDPTLRVVHWSESAHAYLDRTGARYDLPDAEDASRAVTWLEREGRRTTAVVHDPVVLEQGDLVATVLDAARLVVDADRPRGRGARPTIDARELPTGFITLLMTDIESSTALVRRLGDRYRDLLRDVRAALDAAVTEAGGHVVDARADDFFAVFDGPDAAIRAAVEGHRALAAHAWPDGVSVRVRAGVHSGCATLTDIGYIGIPVHTTARVCAAAHGGQIVVTGQTRTALAGDLPDGIRLVPLGTHRLQGLAEPESLFQLEADGLQASFPPPRTAGPAAADS